MNLDWIAVDWGSTRLRAWACSRDGSVLQRADSAQGAAGLAPEQFEPALLELVEPWLTTEKRTTVIACGMAGARQGWIDAPYSAVPCRPLSVERLIEAPVTDPRLRVLIVPGLSQASPADVMRGEETQLAGVLAAQPGYRGLVCLPGTHCKWAELQEGRVIAFRTFMTGELYALLSQSSVLRHSLHADTDTGDGWDSNVFVEATRQALGHPEQVWAELFGLRAQGLLHGQAPATARARLSGLLIGAELAAARSLWQGRKVTLVGNIGLPALYLEALRAQDIEVQALNTQRTTLDGLTQVFTLISAESQETTR
ncbi:2-dehydro-3-deoxygalactonokinase [Marinobacterium sp. D7]|uniref:2-dehydro-3-deoxygalactonokinase n=1 Tax=Marinobacterium ramblicola TaxID=2849041 RepID=UPI001C2DE530|nr:2-dehydro-3-deoxygalactonokinase [Marinobacterium ramblicola]MBV1787644.1 2-dehydro-3-deoxygalactonokinase [Marinobacterium ramblicola]